MRALAPDLTPVEQRVAAQFLADPAGTAALTISELAARSETSTASVVRFSRRLGYEHYRELRLDVDALAAAVDAVIGARRVDVFGVGASAVVGLDLQQKLVRIGRVALEWSDSHAAWTSAATLDRGCVAIAISHSGTTADTIEFLGIARSGGATTVAITNHGASPLAQRADFVLTTAARETSFRSGALGSRIAQLMVVDCLFIGVARATYDASMEALRRTYVAVHRARPEV